MKTIADRVRAGAKLLDQKAPDWHFRVSPERITSIHEPSQCVLCAVFGNFTDGAVSVFDEFVFRERAHVVYFHGFSTGTDEDAEITAEWQRVITERRKAVTHTQEVERVLAG